MFTGIIDHCGRIRACDTQANALRLAISSEFRDWVIGESIAVNGICLTVTHFDDMCFYCDVSPETLSLTTASEFRVGGLVNLERAMRCDDRFGGHVVTGHVDGRAQVLSSVWHGEFLHLSLGGLTSDAMRYFCTKGSVALDGVSLTVNAVGLSTFEVLLIPHTLHNTTLGAAQIGTWLNVEFDYLARYVVRQNDWLQQ